LAIEITRTGEVVVRAPLRCPQREIDRFLQSRSDWIAEHAERQRRRLAARPEPDEAGRAVLIARAKAELPARAGHYAALMGLSFTGITITGARSRFGSCSPKNRLCFSWRLMQYPDAAVDYVVVHELTHLVHRNHGPAFYALVASFLPDWKARRALLKE
jgi:hypothetical protein